MTEPSAGRGPEGPHPGHVSHVGVTVAAAPAGGTWDERGNRGVALMAVHLLPPMPEIGHTEAYYARLSKMADEKGWVHAREAAKVGQYITLALDPHLEWDAKRRYFRHALRRHCVPPAVAHDLVTGFYDRLAILVRENAGREALRLASKQDDLYA